MSLYIEFKTGSRHDLVSENVIVTRNNFHSETDTFTASTNKTATLQFKESKINYTVACGKVKAEITLTLCENDYFET